MFKHKELQQQLMDTKLQRITEMMKEVEEKQQKERDLVSGSPHVSEGQRCWCSLAALCPPRCCSP